MEYLCLVYLDAKQLGGLSKEEMQRVDNGSLEYDEELQRSGHSIMARALSDPKTAMSVRPRGR